MENNNLILEDINRIREIMFGYGVIEEGKVGAIVASVSDDMVKNTLRNTISTTIKDTIDDVVKNASKEAATSLLSKPEKVLTKSINFYSDDFFNKVVKNLETTMNLNSVGVKKLTNAEKMTLRAFLNKDEYKTLAKKEMQRVMTTNNQRLGNVVKGLTDDVVKQGIKQSDDAIKAEVKTGILSRVKGAKDRAKELLKIRLDKATQSKWLNSGILKRLKNGKKYVTKRNVAILAITLTLGYAVVANWFKDNDIPIDPDNTGGDNTGGSNTGGSNTGGSNTGGGTNYTACTDFPYKKNCSSSVVAEVQKCLGLPNDGKFGPKTEAKLKELGYGTEITQDVYNKIKEKCGTSGTTTSTTLPAPEFQDLEVDPDSITI